MSDTYEPTTAIMLVSEPSKLKAFAHPTRVRELEMLIEAPMTTKQLGDALGMSPAQAHYHLKFLERAGLVRLVYRNEKAGVVEKYYRATSRKYIVTHTVGTFGEPGSVILESLAESMLQGAIAGVSGSDVGLVYGASERVVLPRERLGELLGVASMLQAAQESLQALGQGGQGQEDHEGQGEGKEGRGSGGDGGDVFELTFGLYAVPRRADGAAAEGVGRRECPGHLPAAASAAVAGGGEQAAAAEPEDPATGQSTGWPGRSPDEDPGSGDGGFGR